MSAHARFRVVCLALILSEAAWPQSVISTFAGTERFFASEGKPASQAIFSTPNTLAIDSAGNLYVGDLDTAMVARIGTDRIAHAYAGNGIRTVAGDGGPATRASFGSDAAMATDRAGNLYIVDNLHNQIRKVAPDGTISRFAGTGQPGFAGDGGPARLALFRLNGGTGIATDPAGNVYISDRANARIRKIDTNGIINTIAGTGTGNGPGGDGGLALSANLSPTALLYNSAGELVFCDRNRVRKILPSGIVAPVAGLPTQTAGFAGDSGTALNALLNAPGALAQDPARNLFIFDSGNNRIRKVDVNGVITTYAGTGQNGFGGDGGLATQALLSPFSGVGLAADTTGNLFIADSGNARIRQVTTSGIISTIAGTTTAFNGDGGPATSATIPSPSGIAVDPVGNVYIADQHLNRILKVTVDGVIRRVAGAGDPGFAGDTGPALAAQFNASRKVAVDTAGNIYVADVVNHRIRKIAFATGIITTFAGTGAPGYSGDSGPAISAQINLPFAVATDKQGNVYIADTGNARVRKVAPTGVITTVAGTGTPGYNGDNLPVALAQIRNPVALAVDSQGTLYIADAADNRVRKVANGMVSTVAGTGLGDFSGDGGVGYLAAVNTPEGLAIDGANNLYIADALNFRIRKVIPDGTISTIAGIGVQGFSGDGGPPLAAQFSLPFDVAIDTANNIFVADAASSRIRVIRPAPPSFTASPATLSFTGTSGGAATASQTVALTSSTSGIPYTAAANVPWLAITPAAGTMPVGVQITADPSTLAQGTYTATINFTAASAVPAARTVDVTFTVNALIPPKLAASPAALAFSLTNQSPAQSQTLRVSNDGAGTLAFTAAASTTSGGAWLKVLPGGGSATPSAPFAITVTADPSGLRPGTYAGQVALVASSQSLVVPVTFSVSAVPQTILLSQTGLTFVAVANGGRVPSDTVGILNTGQGTMNWTAKASTLSAGPQWLSVSPASGASVAGSLTVPLIEIDVDPTGLTTGDYYGQVRLDAPGASNSPQSVAIVLTVLPPGSNPGPIVRPSGLIFTGVAGGSSPSSQDTLISNITARAVNYVSGRLTSDGQNWLLHAPANAAVTPDAPTRVVVQADLTNLTAGIRRGVITLLFLEDGNTRNVNLLLNVLPAATSSSTREAGGCTPSRLLTVFTLLPDNFIVPVAWPAPVEVRVSDDCGNPFTAGSVTTSFSNGDSPISLAPLGDGRWAATWQPRNGQVSQVTVTASAQDPTGSVRGTAQVTGALRANPNPPVVSSGAVLSAASFALQAPLSPGSLIAIFGAHLADASAISPSLPWSKDLAGTSVVLAGRPLPLQFASDGQINAMIPYDVPTNTRHQLIVQRGTSYAVPEPVTIAEAQPAIFTTSQTGTGQGAIVDLTPNIVDRNHPAQAGDTIVIYCAGLGAVDPPVEAGVAAPLTTLSRTTTPVEVTIGGVKAQVTFAGVTPTYTGLYQVNVVIPPGIAPSDSVPVMIAMNGQQSPPATIAIRESR